MSPAGIFSIMMLLVVGILIGRGVDARWLIAAGLLIMAAGSYWMSLMNLYISPGTGRLAAGRVDRGIPEVANFHRLKQSTRIVTENPAVP